jgi:tetratricopeptide (TPR) repeat protein
VSPATVTQDRQRLMSHSPGAADFNGAIHLMENHDRAYHLWREAGLRQRVLVHIDAHHDMWWIDHPRSLSIANFICPALMESIVREVYWIVPDATWDSSAGRTALRRNLRKILDRYPGERSRIHRKRRFIRASVMGRPLNVCSVDALPPLGEDVLLDIDTDYLMIPEVSYSEWDTHSPLPWRWPSELVDLLRARSVRTDFVTIAYSVEGGYTPLHWKYLGDELACRLRAAEDGRALEPYDRMREALVAQHRGDAVRAEAAFRAIGDRLGAAPFFCLAHLLAERGRVDEGRTCLQRGLALDPSYRAAFSSPGVPLYFERAYRAAERAFRCTLSLDPDDPYAQLGLGWLAAREKRWADAEGYSRASLACQPDLVDAYRLLGQVLVKQERFDDAIQAYEHSMKLALAGHRPFDGVIATDLDAARMLDPAHGRTHALLAALYEQRGDCKRAIAGYRFAMATGYDVPSIRFRLARLYAGQHKWSDARQHTSTGLKKMPHAAREKFARVVRHARDMLTEARSRLHNVASADTQVSAMTNS